MSNIIRWPLHTPYRCPPGRVDCIEGRCAICQGGLTICTVCGGAEASLTTDCWGLRLSPAILTQVQEGVLDYTRKNGWLEGLHAVK